MNASDPPISKPSPRRMRRLARGMLWLLLLYLIPVLMLTALQRHLIYLPLRGAVPTGFAETGYDAEQLRSVAVAARDGVRLHGWLIEPDGDRIAGAARLAPPLVIFYPGNGGHRLHRLNEIHLLTSLGCRVLIVDYRGYAENEGAPSEQAFAEDARSIWDYATGRLDASPDRIVLWGESLGGAVATRLAAELSQQGTAPGGVILRGAFTSLADAGSHHYPWLPVRWVLVDRYPSIDRIAHVDSPLLLIHGARDRIIPIEQGERLFAAAPERSRTGVPKTFVELPDAGHNDVMHVAEDEVRRAVSEFLNLALAPHAVE